MKLVRLVAPDVGTSFTDLSGKTYAVGPKCEVDVPEELVSGLLAEGFRRAATTEVVLVQGPAGNDGQDGEPGPRGERGPIGPMPRHEWNGTELRFEFQPGQWGAWVDLQGPRGEAGRDGAPTTGGGIVGAGPINIDAIIAAIGGSISSNSWTPSGW